MLDYKAISAVSGYAVQSLRQWRSEGKMPEPDFIIGGSPVWKERTIAKWLKLRERSGNPQTRPRSRTESSQVRER